MSAIAKGIASGRVYHHKIKRNSTASICQAYDLDFPSRSGKIGKGYIEAHHLKLISTLEEGVVVTFNVKDDFAVLCANCHRVIHRTDDPSDLDSFGKDYQKSLTR